MDIQDIINPKTDVIVKPRRGGKRPGAGMKKGTKIKRTLEKEKIMKAYKDRILGKTDYLFNAQFANAVGNLYVYKVVNKKRGSVVMKEHILVSDPAKIKEILDANDGKSGEVNDNYYIVTVAKPDNQALSDMLDRAFGKATQSIETKDESTTLLAEAMMKLAEAKNKQR